MQVKMGVVDAGTMGMNHLRVQRNFCGISRGDNSILRISNVFAIRNVFFSTFNPE